MDEKTRHYTHAYLKNLFVCYMTIPAFLIANALGSIIAENIMPVSYTHLNVKKAVSLIQNPANIKMMLIKQIGSFLNPFKEL